MSIILYLRRATEPDIAKLKASPESTAKFLFEPNAQENGDLIDFDKAWQAVHFTLSGAEYATDDPLGAMLAEGEQIGEDIGYGRPWIIPQEKMQAFAEALSHLSDDDIRGRYDPAEMVANDIYFADAFQDEPEEGYNYLMQSVPALRSFAQKCAETRSCALVAIS